MVEHSSDINLDWFHLDNLFLHLFKVRETSITAVNIIFQGEGEFSLGKSSFFGLRCKDNRE